MFGARFGDWSWDSVVASDGGVLHIAFERPYAAFNVHRTESYRPTRYVLETCGRIDASVLCSGAGEFAEAGELVAGGSDWRRHEFDLSGCAAGTPSAYWEFASGFGAYDRDAGAWRAPLLDALID